MMRSSLLLVVLASAAIVQPDHFVEALHRRAFSSRTSSSPSSPSSIRFDTVIGFPRGGGGGSGGRSADRRLRSNESSATTRPSLSAQVQTVFKNLMERKATAGTRAMGDSLIVFIAGFLVLYGMNQVRNLYPTQAEFLFGTNKVGRKSAELLCAENKSILFAYPATISETLSPQTGITNILVGSLLTLSSLFIMVSKLGLQTGFPVESNHIGVIFNVFRMLCPVVATFLIPRIFQPYGGDMSAGPGRYFQSKPHGMAPLFSWFFCSLCELISSVHSLFLFLKQKESWLDKFIPSDVDEDQNKGAVLPKEWVATLYKSLWLGLTIIRGAFGVLLLYIFIKQFSPALAIAGGSRSATTSCQVLQTIRSNSYEWNLTALLGGMYMTLALSQLCESSGRRLSSLLYIIPLMLFSGKNIGKTLSNYIMSNNMPDNYLKIVNMPGGKFDDFMKSTWNSYLKDSRHTTDTIESRFGMCTAVLKNLDKIPKTCFTGDYDASKDLS